MSQVQIQKPKDHYDLNDFLFGRWAERARKIEHRAYGLFEKRGREHGRHLEDWLEAEREMNGGSTCEVDIGEKAVTIVLTVPGFAAGDITVNLVPGMAVVEGEADEQATNERGGVIADEEVTRSFLHQIPLPEAADIYAASAIFQEDELRIAIPLKGLQSQPQKAAAVGAR